MSTSNPNLHPFEAAERQRSLILRIVRATFFVLIVTFTLLVILRGGSDPAGISVRNWWLPAGAAVVLFGVALAADLLTPRKKISTVSGVMFGVLAGMIATLAIGFVVDLILQSNIDSEQALKTLQPTVSTLKILLGITLCYLGVSTILQTQDEFRLVIPYVEFAKQIRGPRPILLDSSVLVDARLADVAPLNLLQAPIVVPRFVIAELQQLADSSDATKRARGRRGLDVIGRLQRTTGLDVTIDETVVGGKAVDQMLVELAKRMQAIVATTDVGLSRVAAIQQVAVLNINELANALKPSVVAGEPLTVRLVRAGEQAGQGVGYLADGTMIVAEDGGANVGQQVTLTVTSQMQTSAGRLIFGRINPEKPRETTPANVGTPDDAQEHLHADDAPIAEHATTNGHATSPEASSPIEHAGTDAAANEPARPRTPYPPKPPASLRAGSPRNPRR